MKIGILTHHYVKNYGAYLQMKALFETVKSNYPEADIYIIDYVKKKHWIKNVIHILHYRRGIDTFSTYCKKIKQLFVFTKYERSFPRTQVVWNSKDINKCKFDLIILGSDEIWNILGSGHNPMKFGFGLDTKSTNVIAYAPSVGAVTEDVYIDENIRAGVSSLKKVSGRDNETMALLKRVGILDAEKMLDPTFLYNFDVDIDREGVQSKKAPYILIYDCKLTDEQVYQLKSYARENNLKIIGAGDYKNYYDEVTINLTPFEWVNLFRNAEKVITGTFHGTVFSIKYRRDFVCYPTEKNRINKIKSLLQDMFLEDRLLKVGNEQELINYMARSIDYDRTYEYIDKKVKEANKFLKEV